MVQRRTVSSYATVEKSSDNTIQQIPTWPMFLDASRVCKWGTRAATLHSLALKPDSMVRASR